MVCCRLWDFGRYRGRVRVQRHNLFLYLGAALTMKLTDIKLLQDGLYIRRLPWLSMGGREIYYDDIVQIEPISSDGRDVTSLVLKLKNDREVRLNLSSQDDVERLKAELEETIRGVDCEAVIIGTPIDLRRLISIKKPSVRVRYELQEIGRPNLEDVLAHI